MPIDGKQATDAVEALPGTVIVIRDFHVPVLVGVHPHERNAPQPLRLDIEIELPGRAASRSDRLADTLDYAKVVDEIRARLSRTRFLLLERLADDLGRHIVERYGASRASVQAMKLGILPGVGAVGVRIETRAPAEAGADLEPLSLPTADTPSRRGSPARPAPGSARRAA